MLAADTYLNCIRNESQALAAAAREGGLDAAVSTCPGWKMGRLVGHVGTVHNWAGEIVQNRLDGPPDRSTLERPPEGDGVIGWLESKTRSLSDALRGAGSETKMWNFTAAPKRSDFWHRRMAHETAIHRVDGELAAGRSVGTLSRIDPEVAADGIDEFLDHMMPADVRFDVPATIHLHATDTPGEWLLEVGPDGVSVSREHAKGDLAVRGPAQQLLLLLWNRVPADAEGLEVFGDQSLLDTWRDRVTR